MLIFCGSWCSISHADPKMALLNLNIGLTSLVGSIWPSIAAVRSISLLNSGPQRTYRPIADVGIPFRLIFLWQTAIIVDMVSTSLKRSVTFNRTFEKCRVDRNPLIRWNVTQHLNHNYCHTDERNMVDSCERGHRKSPGGSEGYPPLVVVKCKDAHIRCGTRGKVVSQDL